MLFGSVAVSRRFRAGNLDLQRLSGAAPKRWSPPGQRSSLSAGQLLPVFSRRLWRRLCHSLYAETELPAGLWTG